MGINANVLIADSPLPDTALAELGLEPLNVDLSAEEVMLTPAERRASVIRTEGRTIIVDGSDALADVADDSGLASLPGRIVFAASVSIVDFSDLIIVDDGRVVRHLRQEEGEITINEGEPLAAETEFIVEAGDDSVGDGDSAGEDGFEIDGDLLVQRLPVLAGMNADTDIFTLTGQAFVRASGYVSTESEPQSGTPTVAAPSKRGFFSRLFGR